VHHSQHTAVQKLIADGEIGRPQVYEIAFGIPARPDGDIRNDPVLGGGALLDLGVYAARAIRMLCEPDDGGGVAVAGAVQHANVVAAFTRAAVGGAPFGPQGEALLCQAALVERIRATARAAAG